MKVLRDIMSPARDGVLLAVDVYMPDEGGPFPTIAVRTPYERLSLIHISEPTRP